MVPSAPQPASEPDLSNHRIGDYLIGRRLGRGGMAEVYLAEQQSLRRQVAFKVLRSTLAIDESFVRRFHHEAQAAASLVHANIVQIYEVGCIDGIHFIAQEYVDGQNLKQLILRRGKLNVRQAVSILRQVTAALHKAGQRGIVHRDIKPENILLTSGGEVKVADFGLARVAVDNNRVDLTQVGMTLGTPLYMSPEQVEGQSLDPRSDLYSLGVMTYEMLAGRPPFEGDNAFSVAVQHLKKDAPRLETLREDLPGGLARIVHTLLEKQKTDRFQSAAEVMRELRMIQIEGLENLPTDEDWNSPEWEAMATSRLEATQRLRTVMLRETRLSSRAGIFLIPALLISLAFAGGCGLAWILKPRFLLEVAANEIQQTPIQANAREQYLYAFETAKERDYMAVAEYFPRDQSPENDEYIRLAQLQLAYMYFFDNRLAEASRVVEELVAQDADLYLRTRALVLQVNILARQPGREIEAMSRLVPLLNAMKQANRTSWPDRLRIYNELEKPVLRDQFVAMFDEQFRSPPDNT